jgi:hypothetical protein
MVDGHSKALQALRQLTKSKHTGADVFDVLERLRVAENTDSAADRSAALIAGSILDQALQEAISTNFVPLEKAENVKLFDGDYEREAILGSYYSRIYVAYALKVFGQKTLRDLNTIRTIRNAFAHFHGHLSFNTAEIATLCDFEVLEDFGDENWMHLENRIPTAPREKFLAAIYLFALYLQTAPGDVKPKTYGQVGTPPLFA